VLAGVGIEGRICCELMCCDSAPAEGSNDELAAAPSEHVRTYISIISKLSPPFSLDLNAIRSTTVAERVSTSYCFVSWTKGSLVVSYCGDKKRYESTLGRKDHLSSWRGLL
jgi:hypothetical protein